MSHMLKDIAVFFDASIEGQRILETAARLAAQQAAHLIGITSVDEQEGVSPADSFARGDAILEVIHTAELSKAARLLRSGQRLEQVARGYDLRAEYRAVPYSESGSALALHSLYCDLLVVSHPRAPGAPFAWSPSQVLRESGVPLLIVPAARTGLPVGRRIAVAWNASRPSRRAIADALPLLTAAESTMLLIVDAERNAEAHGEEPGADMAAYLSRHGVAVELVRVASQGRSMAGAIVAQAIDWGADLLVFGGYSRPRFTEALLGGVTRTLLHDVPMPLFVSH